MGGAGGSDGVSASAWIVDHFANDPQLTGPFTSRTRVETPALIIQATATNAKYAFDVREEESPDRKEAGFVDVTIADLASPDHFGAGIGTLDDGMTLYLSRVTIEPKWDPFVDYATTNQDGIVLDGSVAIYAEDLTITNVNSDTAIDNKATASQFVRLSISGPGHRSIRYWRDGPHYLVESSVENDQSAGSGALLWFKDCDTVQLKVYDTTFDGSSTVAPNRVSCDSGSDPNIEYLSVDPRTTGEMHEMFSASE